MQDQTSAAIQLLNRSFDRHAETLLDPEILCRAVINGNLTLVKALCEAGVNIELPALDSTTPLHLAAQGGNLSILKYLLSFDPQIDQKNKVGMTSLHIATYWGHTEIVKELLREGADYNTVTERGYSVLLAAAVGRQPDVNSVLLSYYPNLEVIVPLNRTVLSIAVENEDLQSVKLLLGAGISVSPESSRWKPIHEAAKKANLEIVKDIVNAGASIDTCTDAGYTPLMVACRAGLNEMVDFLIENGAATQNVVSYDGSTLYHEAALSNKVSMLEKVFLLNGQGEVDQPQRAGIAPFHVACREADITILRWLTDQGADPHRLTTGRGTSLHFAAITGDLAKIRFLLNLRVSHTTRDTNDNSPLEIACTRGHYQAVKEVIENGADFSYQNRYTKATCLHHTAVYGHVDCAKILIQKGANLEVRDYQSLTPLLLAIACKRKKRADLPSCNGGRKYRCMR